MHNYPNKITQNTYSNNALYSCLIPSSLLRPSLPLNHRSLLTLLSPSLPPPSPTPSHLFPSSTHPPLPLPDIQLKQSMTYSRVVIKYSQLLMYKLDIYSAAVQGRIFIGDLYIFIYTIHYGYI